MTEKQVERVRTKIANIKRALAEDKKRWGGYYDDSAGLRYAAPGLYLKIRDFKGSMNYFRWFDKHFPDDGCYGVFFLEWALTLFMLGKTEEAKLKVIDAYFSDTRVLNKFFGKAVTPVDETINSFELEWAEKQIIGYSAEEKDWAAFAVWLEALLASEPFQRMANDYLVIQRQLVSERDVKKRRALFEKEKMVKSKGL